MEKGFYYKQLKKYYDVFPKEQIKIILFEDMIKNPGEVTQEVFKFLGVDSSFICWDMKVALFYLGLYSLPIQILNLLRV